jgi:hypothetical protein
LRLKFEEKVNAVFASYEEIRLKYDSMLLELALKGDEGLSSKQV